MKVQVCIKHDMELIYVYTSIELFWHQKKKKISISCDPTNDNEN